VSYFTQTHIFLIKVSKNCLPRISRKSIQQEPSSSMRTEKHDKASSCFSRLIIWNYLTPSIFSDINTLHVRLSYYFLFATYCLKEKVLMLPVITEHDLSSVSFQSRRTYVICLNKKKGPADCVRNGAYNSRALIYCNSSLHIRYLPQDEGDKSRV